MRIDAITMLDELAADERSRITTREVRERLGMSPQAASNLMTRLVESGFLDRVGQGKFALRPLGLLGTRAASEDVALAVGAAFRDEPHRVGYRSALDHHGLLVHPSRTVQLVLPRRAKPRQISGRQLRPIYEDAATISVGAEPAGHGASVSTIERAMLESASRPDLVGGWITLATALQQASLDAHRLVRLAMQIDAGVSLRRLASLAEAQGRVDVVDAFGPPDSNVRVIPLDPRDEGDEPWTDLRWRVRWPTSTRAARALIDA